MEENKNINNQKNNDKEAAFQAMLNKKKSQDKGSNDDDIKGKMDKLIAAQKVLDEDAPKKEDSSNELNALKEEKAKVEKQLKDAKAALKALYALEYEEKTVLDKKKNALSKDFLDAIKEDKEKTANDAKEEELAKEKQMNDELKMLQTQIKALKLNNEASKKANEEALQAALAASEAAEQARKTFEEREQDANRDFKAEIEDLENQVKTLEADKKKIDKDLKKKSKDLEALKGEKDQLVNDHKKEINQLNKDIDKLSKEKEKNDELVAKLKADLSQAVKDQNKANQKAAKLEEANKNQKDEISDLKKNINSLEKDLDKASKKVEDLTNERDDLSYLKKDNLDLEKEVMQAQAKADKANDDVSNMKQTKQAEINLVKKEMNEKFKEEKAAIRKENNQAKKALNKEIDKLNKKLEELNNKIAELEKDNKSKDKEIKKLNSKIASDEEMLAQIAIIEENLNKAHEEIITLNENKDAITKELLKAKEILKNQKALLDEQLMLLDEQSETLDAKNLEISSINKVLSDYKFENAHLRSELDEKNTEEAPASEVANALIDSNVIDDPNKEIYLRIKDEVEESDASIGGKRKLFASLQASVSDYLEKIMNQESNIAKYIVSLNEKEKQIENIKAELEQVKEDKDKEIDQKIQEIEILNSKLDVLSEQARETERLEISKFNETRLQSRILELEREIKVLSLKNVQVINDSTLVSNLEQTRNLLESERKSHIEVENNLNQEVVSYKNQLEEMKNRLAKLSSSYLLNALNRQVEAINKIIDDVGSGKIAFNYDLFSDYYTESLKMYEEQKKIYSDELNKRNEILKMFKEQKEEQIKKINEEVMVNPGMNKSQELKALYRDINDIEILINSSVKTYSPLPSQNVQKEIVKSFKKEILKCHKQMEDNIQELSKEINDKYDSLKTLDELLATYRDDCNEMARQYANEMNKLHKLIELDDNEFTKIVNEEKIIMLANEFESLVIMRDSKYNALIANMGSTPLEVNKEEFAKSLDSIEIVKTKLNKQISDINEDKQKEKDLLLEEQKHLYEDIKSLREQLNRLENFDGNEDEVIEDKNKVKVLLAGKLERLDFLKTTKANEVETKYNVLIENVKKEFGSVSEEEKNIRDIYARRVEDANNRNRMTASGALSLSKANEIKKINDYLLNLNLLDETFDSAIANRTSSKPFVHDEREAKLNELLKKYRELWKLHEKYTKVSASMVDDFKDIRDYIALTADEKAMENQYNKYRKEIDKCTANVNKGLDASENKDNILLYSSKAKALSNKVEYLKTQSKDLLNKKAVSDYAKITDKIDQIVKLIKQYDLEIEQLIKG